MSPADATRPRVPLPPDATIGGVYRVMALLGTGAMGEVYRARDTRLGRDVAVKLLPPSATSEGASDLARHEAGIVASLNHPNILALFDVGMHDGAMYLVTELIDGESLRGVVLTVRKSLEVAAQIADGLSAAHTAGVIHRDLKPDNVMVTRDGRVKLLDFGVAKSAPLPADALATISPEDPAVVAGTPGYMAPEQIRAAEIDGRADIFSFGALLYELLSGTRAFGGETAADVLSAVLTDDPPELPASVPAVVRQIVYRCLEKAREDRFQSARDLAFAIRQAAAGSGAAIDSPSSPPGIPPPSAVRGQLARLLASAQLANAERLSSLLRFIVEETLGGRGSQLKEARIGLEVFGRRADSYDPAIDPIVRVQMGRLRSKLRRYYSGEGAGDDVRIDVPLGGYVPAFATRRPDSPPVPRASMAPPPADDLRLAVLPIVNMSADPDNQYFCDGLTDELINQLAQTPGLRVVARTSSFQFKDAARDIREVGRLLDVSKVLEGSVRKAGERIRVTVQLINAADGCHLWSKRYEGEITDIFAIHEKIATAIQRALQIQFFGAGGRPGRKPRTQALDAYNHYLQGRFLWNQRTEQGLRGALAHFERAVRLDPTFARALAGMADCHLMLGMSAAEAPEHSMPHAADAARRALHLDDTLAEARTSLAAVMNCYDWDLRAAESEYRRSLALDSSYATTLHWFGLFHHAAVGRLALAVDALEQAIELDPLSPPIIADLAIIHALREDFDAAEMYCRRALDLDPHFHRSFWFLGLNLAWSNRFPAAEQALKRALDLCPGSAFRARLLGALGFVYGRWGKPRLAHEVIGELDRLRQTSYVPSFELAQIQMGLGERTSALVSLEDAVARRESYAIFANAWLPFRPLKGEPRFETLMARIGLAPQRS